MDFGAVYGEFVSSPVLFIETRKSLLIFDNNIEIITIPKQIIDQEKITTVWLLAQTVKNITL